jgi:hypothetical protein
MDWGLISLKRFSETFLRMTMMLVTNAGLRARNMEWIGTEKPKGFLKIKHELCMMLMLMTLGKLSTWLACAPQIVLSTP